MFLLAHMKILRTPINIVIRTCDNVVEVFVRTICRPDVEASVYINKYLEENFKVRAEKKKTHESLTKRNTVPFLVSQCEYTCTYDYFLVRATCTVKFGKPPR